MIVRRAVHYCALLAFLVLGTVPVRAAMPVDNLSEPVSIAGQWKFRTGDNEAWSDSVFDDSSWQETLVPGHAPQDYDGYSGLLWYRLTLQLDMSQPSVRDSAGALAVTIGSVMSAYEFYAGGIRLGSVGQLPPTPAARYDEQRTWFIPPAAVGDDGRLVLALRVWRSPAIGSQWETGPYFGEFLLGNLGDLRAKSMRDALFPNVVLAALYLILGLYHLLVARRNPVLKEFFWFGLFGIAVGIYTFETSQSKFFFDIPYLWHKKLEFLLLYASPVLFGKTLLSVTRTASNKLVDGLHAIFGLYFLFAVFASGAGLLLSLKSFQYLAAFWALVMAGLMAWEAYKGRRAARVIVVLLLILVAAVINDVILKTPLVASGNVLYLVFALMLFCVALMMAERYTEILKQLESRVAARTAELVDANRELAAAVETKGNFLANMSHEMRTPMNAILGLTRLGMKTELTEQQRDYFGKVEQSAEGLQDIIDSILDFSKLADGELECVSQSFEPTAVAEGLRRVWEDAAREAELELNVAVDSNIPQVLLGDAKRLKQVLSIFVSNALKFTENGKVGVELTLLPSAGHAARVRFAVSDTGAGIHEDQRKHLFEAFSQADNSMTRKHGGTGLGLSIAERLVELMGGQIEVESTVGAGSTFSFELELPVPKPSVEEEDVGLDLTPIRGARVLLVDDSELNLQVAGELLRQAKLRVDTALNGRQAVEKATSQPYDCILMDVQMPVMDGYTATEQIRAKSHLDQLPILAMTANAMQQDRERGTAAGMNDYIPKPIDPDELHRALLRWIEPGERDFDEQQLAAAHTAEAVTDALPDSLPGVNISAGLKRVANNAQLYLSLLNDLCNDYADAPERLQIMLDGGDTDGARQFAHKLRGIANNLGADETGTAAETIELEIKDGALPDAEAMQRLAESLAELGRSQQKLAPLMVSDESAAELDDEQRHALFIEVTKAIADSNPEALDLIDKLLGGLEEDTSGYTELAAARDALDMYDFAGAAGFLESAANKDLQKS
ncbi:MAG: response regulator [Woeseia sp.]|nr:response regulator [Woeseia sp.]